MRRETELSVEEIKNANLKDNYKVRYFFQFYNFIFLIKFYEGFIEKIFYRGRLVMGDR